MKSDILLETKQLKKYYGTVHAVDGVSLSIQKGQSLGLIGESGSGKSTFGKLVTKLEKPSGGEIRFLGRSVENIPEWKFRPLRKEIQIVFQSSGDVFDPCYTVGDSIREGLHNYTDLSPAEIEDYLDETFERVGLNPALKNRAAKQLSGGQCQRANIARALILHPQLIVCDEPVSSLDYSIRKQMLNLLNKIQEQEGITYLCITHDLSNVPYVCKAVAIMYHGRIVEYLDHTDNLGENVMHPYSRLLFESVPVPDPRKRTINRELPERVQGENLQKGCPFRGECPIQEEICAETMPLLSEESAGHKVACHCLHKIKNIRNM